MKTIESRSRMSKEERRRQIIDSAMRIFVERGYNGATTSDIAKKAGISEVTLFRYFSSKKELFMSGIEPILITTLEESIIEAQNLQPIDKLKHFLRDRIKMISKHNGIIKLILMESQINPELAEFNYVEKTITLLKESIKDMGIHLKDEDLSIRLLMGGILSFLYLPEIDEDKIELYIENFVCTIIKVIKLNERRID